MSRKRLLRWKSGLSKMIESKSLYSRSTSVQKHEYESIASQLKIRMPSHGPKPTDVGVNLVVLEELNVELVCDLVRVVV